MAEDASKLHLKLGGWKCSPNPAPFSPMTNLALNLKELTCLVDTPKRRISWSSSGSDSPCRPQLLSFGDDGFCDSPAVSCDSPFECSNPSVVKSCGESVKNRSLLQRLHSVPLPAVNQIVNKENIDQSSECWVSPSKNVCKEDKIFDDSDSTSRDSGFSEKDDIPTSKLNFKFIEPVGTAPRRLRTLSEHSPNKQVETHQHHNSPLSLITLPFNQCNSPDDVPCTTSSSRESEDDDGFLDGFDYSDINGTSQLISVGISHLLNGRLTSFNDGNFSANTSIRPPLQLLHNIDTDTPKSRSCIRGLFDDKKVERNELDRKLAIKRSEVPRDYLSPVQNKRRKSTSFCHRKFDRQEFKVVPKRITLQRCHSENEATIMKAIQRSVQEPNLIGDFTKPYLLPLMKGRHSDLNTVSPNTLSRLIFGEFEQEVEKFIIVDCRYPYEFEGGHIKGASNIFTKEGIMQEFLCIPIKIQEGNKRLVVIFHCEFSSERGPSLSRFLREKDREANKECYPHLHYPELYLLEGGYKAFYENHAQLCEPQDYKPMLHKDHEKDMRLFRAKSRSWNSDRAGRQWSHPGLKL